MDHNIAHLKGAAWRKSSHSDAHGNHCVETAPLDATWFKSSHSGAHDTRCVETAQLDGAWFKSSHSDPHGNDCVETAELGPHVGVRDSKNADGPALVVSVAQWRPFLVQARNGNTQHI